MLSKAVSVDCKVKDTTNLPSDCPTTEGERGLAVLKGAYSNDMDKDGWGKLSVASLVQPNTNGGGLKDDLLTAYGGGYAEGFLTSDLMAPSLRNILSGMFNKTYNPHPAGDKTHQYSMPPDVVTFLEQHWGYVSEGAERAVADASQAREGRSMPDAVWAQVAVQRAQLLGLLDGYNSAARPSDQVDLNTLLANNLVGDMDSILVALQDPKNRPDYGNMSNEEAMRISLSRTHCSALVKLLPDFSDVIFTHNTWGLYSSMLRIYKRISLKLHTSSGETIVYSSYPGILWSNDDFYMTSNGLAIQETTNHIYDNSLYDLIRPTTLVTMWRAMAANRIARSGPEWADAFSVDHSGTYNNQWMVLDFNLFKPRCSTLPSNLVTVMEEYPGYFRSQDATSYLQFGHWPSFNRPFFDDSFVYSGHHRMVERFGEWYSYTLSPRSKIFRRDAGAIHSIDDARNFMRYNKWQTDPLSDNLAANTIACRSDLIPANSTFEFYMRECEGAIDVKMTSFEMFSDGLKALVIAGPTNDDQPTFEWTAEWDSTRWPECAHEGQPHRFDFDWVLIGDIAEDERVV